MEIDENLLTLDEFINLPTTVSFNVVNIDRFQAYARDKPYIRLGTQLANLLVIAYTNQKNISTIACSTCLTTTTIKKF